jgi:Arc/MetJ-type ribon-helix-helix transcriptional regulator
MSKTISAVYQERLQAIVERGRYQDAEEVLEEALHLLDVRDAELERRRVGARDGFAQIERGDFKYLDELDEEDLIQRALTKAAAEVGKAS